MKPTRPFTLVMALALVGACGRADERSADGLAAEEAPGSASAMEKAAAEEQPLGELFEKLLPGMSSGGEEIPAAASAERVELPAIDRPCPPVEEAAEEEIAEQAGATIPLVVGLTLSNTWIPPQGDRDRSDHECLSQVTAVERERIVISHSCPTGRNREDVVRGTHQICRADLREGRFYRTSNAGDIPELQSGTTSAVLSRRTFRELEQTGSAWLRFVELAYTGEGASPLARARPTKVLMDVAGRFERTGKGTVRVVVNDRTVDLPVLLAAGEARRTPHHPNPNQNPGRIRLAVLYDERLPLVLSDETSGTGAAIRYTKITYPSRASIERELAEVRRAAVYGIYFAYNSAEIREESEAVLREIAGVLERHPDWRLRLEGHTDSIGGAAFNRQLSLRRVEAVRSRLVEKYGIDGARLQTAGLGAIVPKDRNDTPEGRARNRRVELIRQ